MDSIKKAIKMQSWMAWVQRPSGLIKRGKEAQALLMFRMLFRVL